MKTTMRSPAGPAAAFFAAFLALCVFAGCPNPVETGGEDNDDEGGRVEIPVATPGPGAVQAGTTVTLSTATAGAIIYYTIDGRAPAAGAGWYGTSVIVTQALTIKAIAVKEGMETSGVLEAAYTVAAARPSASPEAGEVAAGTRVTLSTSTEGAIIHYTTDGTTPTSASPRYDSPLSITAAMTIKAIAVKEGLGDSTVLEAAYTVAAENTAARPSASPEAGEVAAGTMVTLSTSTEGALIHYTTDGTTPTSASPRYDSPLSITATMTIKAIAVKEGLADSTVLEAAYTIRAGEDQKPAVRFDKNGGETEAEPSVIEAEGGTLGSLPAPPSRSGYYFTGWNTQADGSGAEFSASTPVSAGMTVYAQWREITVLEYNSLEAMKTGLALLADNRPEVPYQVKLGSGVSFSDMTGTVMVGDPPYLQSDDLAGLLEAASGKYVALDLRDISRTGGTEVPAGAGQKALEGYTEANDYLVSLALPEWVTKIGRMAFYKLAKLESVNLEETGVTEIADDAFSETGIRSVKLPASLGALGRNAFNNNKRLVSVDMSALAIKEIPRNCFDGCAALEAIQWPPDLETINANAFRGAGFVTLVIPGTVKTIETDAFSNNAALTWLKWDEAPAGAKGDRFITNCGKLVRVAFPATMTHSITHLSFTNCGSLLTVILPVRPVSSSDVPNIALDDDYCLPGTNPDIKVYVPADKTDTYIKGWKWRNIPGIAEIIRSLEDLPESERPENWGQ